MEDHTIAEVRGLEAWRRLDDVEGDLMRAAVLRESPGMHSGVRPDFHHPIWLGRPEDWTNDLAPETMQAEYVSPS